MFGLVLSKTIKLDVNLSEVHVQIIDDEPCRVNILLMFLPDTGCHLYLVECFSMNLEKSLFKMGSN